MRQPRAVPIVERQAQIAVRAGTKPQLRQAQLLRRQIEDRPVVDQERPVLAVAAALEADALEERRRQSFEADRIDEGRIAQIGFESARPDGGRKSTRLNTIPVS